jgi:hypothetical protein
MLDRVRQIERMIADKEPAIVDDEGVLDVAHGIVIVVADRVMAQKAAASDD